MKQIHQKRTRRTARKTAFAEVMHSSSGSYLLDEFRWHILRKEGKASPRINRAALESIRRSIKSDDSHLRLEPLGTVRAAPIGTVVRAALYRTYNDRVISLYEQPSKACVVVKYTFRPDILLPGYADSVDDKSKPRLIVEFHKTRPRGQFARGGGKAIRPLAVRVLPLNSKVYVVSDVLRPPMRDISALAITSCPIYKTTSSPRAKYDPHSSIASQWARARWLEELATIENLKLEIEEQAS